MTKVYYEVWFPKRADAVEFLNEFEHQLDKADLPEGAIVQVTGDCEAELPPEFADLNAPSEGVTDAKS